MVEACAWKLERFSGKAQGKKRAKFGESGGHQLGTPQPLHVTAQRQQLDGSRDSRGAGATSKCNGVHEIHLLPFPALETPVAYRDR